MGFEIEDSVLVRYYDTTGVTDVVIPDSVKSIGKGAFQDCVSLESVTIPDTIAHISGSAFDDCDPAIFNYIKTGDKSESQTDNEV